MIKFNKPENLNGAELISELNFAGISLIGLPLVDGNNDLWLDIDSADEAKAKSIVESHNGTTIAPEPTVQDKLASVGLSLDDLKIALGL